MSYNWIAIFVMAFVTYLIRTIPLTLIRKPITNQFIKSFLYYVPYVTLAVMTFPAIIEATSNPLVGMISLIIGIIAAYNKASLFTVAIICCVIVYLLQIFI